MLPSLIGVIASSGGAAAAAGSYESISTVTVGAGGSSSISFSSIPNTYQHLQIRYFAQSTSGESIPLMRFNSDTGSNYAWHQLYGDGSSAGSSGGTSSTSIFANNYPATANVFGGTVLDILDYANTSKYKTSRALGGYDINGGGQALLRSGLWMSTSAITTITFTPTSGNFAQYSSFALYGIKG